METLRFEIQPLTYVYRKLQLLTVKKAKVVCSVDSKNVRQIEAEVK